jgi:hypothetical protein
MDRPKVFGIGFHKTGTTSLRDALKILGYRVTGPNFAAEEKLGDDLPERAAKLAEEYDAFQDNPWPILFRQMDERFPGSKFVLTVRDADRWYASALRHFGTRESPRRKLIYGVGSPAGNEAIYKRRFLAHNQEVVDYFADRPNDILIMDVTKGDGWELLCPFLGHPIPDSPFPHSNLSNKGIRSSAPVRLARRLRSRFGLAR